MVNIKTKSLPPGCSPISPLEASWGKASGVGGKHKPVRPESGRICSSTSYSWCVPFLGDGRKLSKSLNFLVIIQLFFDTRKQYVKFRLWICFVLRPCVYFSEIPHCVLFFFKGYPTFFVPRCNSVGTATSSGEDGTDPLMPGRWYDVDGSEIPRPTTVWMF